MLTGENFIGTTTSAQGKIHYSAYNPANNEKLNIEFVEATKSEADDAVVIANQAFSAYKNSSGIKKSEFLNGIADEIENLGNELVTRAMSETGLPEGRILGERGRTTGQLRMFADLVKEGSWIGARIDKALPERQPIPKPDIRQTMIPIGPVVVFGASNFPLAFSTAGGDTASALASGCPVIVKSHPSHPGTSSLVAKAIIEAAKKTKMPDGVFSHLNGFGIEIGQYLVAHPQIKAVGFTGSFKAGKALFDIASGRKEPIPIFAEMGSINPVIILPGAMEKRSGEIASQYADSITLGSGQFCTNPGIIICLDSPYLDKFKSNLGKNIDTKEPLLMLNSNIYKTYISGQSAMLSQNGVSKIGEGNGQTEDNRGKPIVAEVSGKKFLTNAELHKEVFGPFSLVIRCKDKVELTNVIQSLEGQLTATIISENSEIEEYTELISSLREKVGRLLFNGVPTGVEVCPSMHHGGPFPASTNAAFTSVGTNAIERFVRPISYQNWPQSLLPEELQNNNPLNLWRLIDGEMTKDKVE